MLNHKYKFKQEKKSWPILEILLFVIIIKMFISFLLLINNENIFKGEHLLNKPPIAESLVKPKNLNINFLPVLVVKKNPVLENKYTLMSYKKSELISAALDNIKNLDFSQETILKGSNFFKEEKEIFKKEFASAKLSFSPNFEAEQKIQTTQIDFNKKDQRSQLLDLKEQMLLELELELKVKLELIEEEKKELQVLIDKNQEILSKIAFIQEAKANNISFNPYSGF